MKSIKWLRKFHALRSAAATAETSLSVPLALETSASVPLVLENLAALLWILWIHFHEFNEALTLRVNWMTCWTSLSRLISWPTFQRLFISTSFNSSVKSSYLTTTNDKGSTWRYNLNIAYIRSAYSYSAYSYSLKSFSRALCRSAHHYTWEANRQNMLLTNFEFLCR